MERTLTAPSTSDYLIGLLADGFGRVSVDGKMAALQYGSQGVEAHLGRVHLVKGEKTVLAVQCRGPADLSMVTEAGQPIIPGGDFTIRIGGGQPDTSAAGVTGHFHVDGQIGLPE